MSFSFDTTNQTFRKIMGNGVKYVVPKFQRDYAWFEEQWEDLWQDAIGASHDDDLHYMGYLVLQTTADKHEYIIIDGQQRLTTISILILAVLKELKQLMHEQNEPDNNRIRLETLKNTYIGFTDPVSLTTQPKLTLNRNNDAYFRNYLCTFESPPIRNVKSSERLLSKALCFFSEKIREKKCSNGQELAEFVDQLVDWLFFTTITVGSDLNAYKVFETLNARGIQLSVPDLLKNYLFSMINASQPLHHHEMQRLEETWEEITGQLGNTDFSCFIHTQWNSRNSLVPKASLFKQIKSTIKIREDAFDYLSLLRKSSEIFAALQDADDSFWKRPDYKGAIGSLRTLHLFNITQPHGLLLVAYLHFSAEDFVRILRYIEVISIRYTIIGRQPSHTQERIYNQLSCHIVQGKVKNLTSIKEGVKAMYLDDKDFAHDFAHKHMKTEQSVRKVRYLLARIEEHINKEIHLEDSELTLEHILPVNPSGNWLDSFESSEMDECADMIGNMTLLTRADNKGAGNTGFLDKKQILAKSTLIISQKCAEYDRWDKRAIEERQQWLAQKAVTCWKIDF